MTTFRKVIENQINKLEDLASSENNEGRKREEEKYLFTKGCFENLLEDLLLSESEIRADTRAKVHDEINNKIEEILKEPQYQHDGEDWRMGLIIAQDVLNELKEQK